MKRRVEKSEKMEKTRAARRGVELRGGWSCVEALLGNLGAGRVRESRCEETRTTKRAERGLKPKPSCRGGESERAEAKKPRDMRRW